MKRIKRRLMHLWGKLSETLHSFETGPSGFYHLPSGKMMNDAAIERKFRKLLMLADDAEATCHLLTSGPTSEEK